MIGIEENYNAAKSETFAEQLHVSHIDLEKLRSR
jgi:hypothetical protein